MQWGGVGRARRACLQRLLRLSVLLAAGLAAAGCSATGQLGGLFASRGDATVAFESIDGPPPGVFREFVTVLGEEAKTRRVNVVSREGSAGYRIRAYFSAQVQRGATSIDWVWDVYDADKRRVLRVAGREPAGRRVRDAWSAADEAMLRRIASQGMERVATFLGAPAAPTATPPQSGGLAVASARDDSPEAAGIVRTADAR